MCAVLCLSDSYRLRGRGGSIGRSSIPALGCAVGSRVGRATACQGKEVSASQLPGYMGGGLIGTRTGRKSRSSTPGSDCTAERRPRSCKFEFKIKAVDRWSDPTSRLRDYHGLKRVPWPELWPRISISRLNHGFFRSHVRQHLRQQRDTGAAHGFWSIHPETWTALHFSGVL